jgi:gliding motility-associated-like protein
LCCFIGLIAGFKGQIMAQNNPPVAVNDLYRTCINTSLTGNLPENDYDPDGNQIEALPVTEEPTNQGGTITIHTNGDFNYIPPMDFSGQDRYAYQIQDAGEPALESQAMLYIRISDTAQLSTTLNHNSCGGDYDGSIDLEVSDSLPGNQALWFNGTNDDVFVPYDASLDITEAITLEAWIKITGETENKWQVIGKDDHYRLRYNNSKLIFYTGGTSLIDTINFADSLWYHLAASYDRDTMRLLINGSEVAKKHHTAGISVDGGQEIRIGKNNFNGWYLEGFIDEVRIWSVSRTKEQIRHNMQKELTGNEDGLQAYWRFNEGEGGIAYDASANNNDGILALPDWVNIYSYSWSGPGEYQSTQEAIGNLGAGVYTCTVAGGMGCNSRITDTITEPPPLYLEEVDSAHRDISYFGAADGQFEVDPSGGSGSYEFSIDTGSTWSSDSVFTELASGEYPVYLRDADNHTCIYTWMGTITIHDPQPLNLTEIKEEHHDAVCAGDENGSFQVRATGGSGYYEYSIDTGEHWLNENYFSQLGKGSYKVWVRDVLTPDSIYTDMPPVTIAEKDTIPPVITCPDTITAYAGKDSAHKNIQINLPQTNDNCTISAIINDHTDTIDASGLYPLDTTRVTYVARDHAGNSSQCSFLVIVHPYNHRPRAITDFFITDEDIALKGNMLRNDIDHEGNTLAVSKNPLVHPFNGSVKIEPDGSFTYTPHPDFFGKDSFQYLVFEKKAPLKKDTGKVNIKIRSVNDTPVASDDVDSTIYEESVSTSVLLNDHDVDHNLAPHTLAVTDFPQKGEISINYQENTISYRPAKNFVGKDAYIYEVCDSMGACSEARVTIYTIRRNEKRVIIPQGFSPNGDGFNDYLIIEGIEKYPNNTLIIFNAWGRKVYEKKHYRNEWDGSIKDPTTLSNKITDGTYYYLLLLGDNKPIRGYIYVNKE